MTKNLIYLKKKSNYDTRKKSCKIIFCFFFLSGDALPCIIFPSAWINVILIDSKAYLEKLILSITEILKIFVRNLRKTFFYIFSEDYTRMKYKFTLGKNTYNYCFFIYIATVRRRQIIICLKNYNTSKEFSFLAHLCELLPSLGVRCPSVNF